MMRILIAFLLTAGVCSSALASDFTEEQIDEINYTIGKYLEEHPEKVIEALNKYQEKQEMARREAAAENLKNFRMELKRDKTTPVIGDRKGDFVIVEFFDYNCGFCKRMFPELLEFVEKDGKTKWVMKEMPSLGDTSVTMAKFALAADKQGKYKEVHRDLMTLTVPFDNAKMDEIIKNNKLDADKIKADMESEEIQKILDSNRELATNLGLSGVPMFIIEDDIKYGAFDAASELPSLAEKARKADKEKVKEKKKDKEKVKEKEKKEEKHKKADKDKEDKD